MMAWFALIFLLASGTAHATTYYISQIGSNSNNGLTPATPWLTFAYAFDPARAWCGDTLILLNGTYGDGTSTGKINLNGPVCTQGNELIIQAQNQRKAKIVDNGTGVAVAARNVAYIIFDGLYARSTDNASSTVDRGRPFEIRDMHHVTVRNSVAVNPNRYANTTAIGFLYGADVLVEGNETYVFHRHCTASVAVERMVVRRQYCNPRDGRIPGGYAGVGASNGDGDAVFSMYPCKDCILENSIADGTQGGMFLNEQNATYSGSVLVSGNKVLGSICYKCDYSNGIYPNPRKVADLNHTPQNITVKDVAFVDHASEGAVLRPIDCMGCDFSHITAIGTGSSTGPGLSAAQNTSIGGTPATNAMTITDSVMIGLGGTAFSVSGYNTWSGNNLWAYNNGNTFNPSLPSNWGTTSTADPQIGTCKLWIPNGSPLKGAGTGGSDIGATILYRYVDGVLTSTPLWDPTTGEFPYGDADSDGINRVAGNSLFDFHTRVNVNTGGCAFPSSFTDPGGGGGGGGAPTNPAGYVRSTDLTGAHTRTISATANRSLTVAVTVIGSGAGPAHATGVTSSCGGQSIPPLADEVLTGTSSGHRSLRIFGLIDANSGTCTLTPTFSAGSAAGWIVESVEELNVGSYGPVSSASFPLTSNPSVTATVNADHTILAFVGTSNTMTVSSGPNQTLTTNYAHGALALRMATSKQSGTDGGFVSYVFGSSKSAALSAVPLISPAPGGGSGSTFRVSNYRIDNLHGTAATPEVTLGPLAAQNTAGEIGATGEFRLRAEVIVENATSTETGVHPYCKKVGGSFARVVDSFGSGFVRFYGAGAEPTIPSSRTPTTQRFTGSFLSGWTSRTTGLAITLPAMPANTRTELDYQLTLGNGLVVDDTIECEIRRDDGTTLGTHTVVPTVKIVGPRASMGF